ncbi:MAG: hypothetical protein RLZ81_947 [Pseudomonadota bacterium]|jgi:hypothetical protein
MLSSRTRCALVALSLSPVLVSAQSQSIPGEIKGRWTYQSLSNTFMLSDIKVAPDSTFMAKLEWWAANRRCSIRGEPVSGRLTDKGIAWDMVTKPPCNDPYSVELNRREKGWDGKITGKESSAVADLTAE